MITDTFVTVSLIDRSGGGMGGKKQRRTLIYTQMILTVVFIFLEVNYIPVSSSPEKISFLPSREGQVHTRRGQGEN